MLLYIQENCPYSHRRPHWQFFNSLINYDLVKKDTLIIDGCIQVAPNMIMRQYLKQPKTLYIVSNIVVNLQ